MDDTLTVIYSRSRSRCRRVLEHLFRVHPGEVLESLIECWHNGDEVLLMSVLIVFANQLGIEYVHGARTRV